MSFRSLLAGFGRVWRLSPLAFQRGRPGYAEHGTVRAPLYRSAASPRVVKPRSVTMLLLLTRTHVLRHQAIIVPTSTDAKPAASRANARVGPSAAGTANAADRRNSGASGLVPVATVPPDEPGIRETLPRRADALCGSIRPGRPLARGRRLYTGSTDG